jgi:hypothetical protein
METNSLSRTFVALSAFLLVSCITPQARGAQVDIYMIGNSYTDDSGSLGTWDAMVLFAESATRLYGDEFDVQFNVTSTTAGGKRMFEHSNSISASSLANGGYEHIILQEQSQLLAIAYESFPTQLNAGQNFFDLHRENLGWPGSEITRDSAYVDQVYYGWFRMLSKIEDNSPNSMVHVFQTWGRTSGYIGGSYDEHIRRNVIMADDILEEAVAIGLADAKVGRAGEAWDYIFDTTSLTLHRDGSHGNALGYYLAAATLFQNILNEEMPGISVANLDVSVTDIDSNQTGDNDQTLLNAAILQSGVVSVQRVLIVQSSESTDVVEGGATDTYTAVLNEAPTADVTVTISTDAEVTVSPNTLTFTTGNWDSPQTVTVTAVDDSDHEFSHTGTVSHTTSSTDPDWNGLSVNDVLANITDDDNAAPSVGAGDPQTVSLGASVSWTPAETSPLAWYDANDFGTITKDGNNKVSAWADKSTNGNDATQSAGGPPTYTASDATVHNMPSIGDSGTSGKIGLVTPSLTAKHVYVVTYYKDGIDASFDGYSTLFSGTGSYGQYRVMANQNTADFIGTSNFNDSGTYKNGSMTSSLTGVLPMPASLFKFKSSAARTQVYGLGFNQAETARDWQGAYCEWIFTDGSEDLETEQKIEGYLAHKWGLQGNLPGDHPHKAAAPGGASIVASLDGTVDDTDGDSLTINWSLFSGPEGATVGFADASAVDTDVTFGETGTYVLRLTVDDGYGAVTSDLTITVEEATGLPQVSVSATDNAASESGQDTGTYTITRTGETTEALDIRFTLSGDASETSDYTLDASSPVTIPIGQSSVDITLTPVNDGGFEDPETATLTITSDAAYSIGTAAADITIADNDNTSPTVDAGNPQTVTLVEGAGGGDPVAGAYFEWDAAADTAGDNVWESTTANSLNWSFPSSQTPAAVSDARFDRLTKAYPLPSAKATGDTFQGFGDEESATFEFVLDVGSDNGVIFETGGGWIGTQFDMHNGNLRFHVHPAQSIPPDTLSVTLTTVDKSRFIHVVGVLDLSNDDMLLYVDGQLVGSKTNFTTSDWGGNGVSGLGQINGDGASTDSPDGVETGELTGKIALFRYYRNKAFTPTEVQTNFDSLSNGSSAVVNLYGTATDLEHSPTTTWSDTGTGTGTGSVTFGDASAVDTTATFTETGTYVLRLTANDGYGEVIDEVTITVTDQPLFSNWVGGYSVGDDTGIDDDPDGDGNTNGEENYFGTDPSDRSSRGLEAGTFTPGAETTFTFTHPHNNNAASDLTATYIWSKDPGAVTWNASGVTDGDGTTVTFDPPSVSDGMATVTARVSGALPDKLFFDVHVTQD